MSRIDDYRLHLRGLDDWLPYLRAESRLPGPRGNLELMFAVIAEGDRDRFSQLLAVDGPDTAPNSPDEFVVVCGIAGLGKLLAAGDRACFATLRRYANHSDWRYREGVVFALQHFGRDDMEGLLALMADWANGTDTEQRAAAAVLCEPALLTSDAVCRRVLDILDGITRGIEAATDRRSDGFTVLRKGMSYCWSVAAAACPSYGKPIMEKWCASGDKDIRRIMRENLKKNRLRKIDATWCDALLVRLG